MFDSHCHFDFAAFDSDREAEWHACAALGLDRLLVPGIEPRQWPVAQSLAKRQAGIYFAVGVHPWYLEKLPDGFHLGEAIAPFVGERECVAIGECGLDAVIDTPMAVQEAHFKQHLEAAEHHKLPLVLHVRKTHAQVQSLLKQTTLPAGGVIHGFSGSLEQAEWYWSRGFRLGIGGTITYDRARKTRRAAQLLPLDAIVLETDAPDMPLQGRQGQRNSPTYLPLIAQALADLREESLVEVQERTSVNAQTLFGL